VRERSNAPLLALNAICSRMRAESPLEIARTWRAEFVFTVRSPPALGCPPSVLTPAAQVASLGPHSGGDGFALVVSSKSPESIGKGVCTRYLGRLASRHALTHTRRQAESATGVCAALWRSSSTHSSMLHGTIQAQSQSALRLGWPGADC
jgi:hypothetical protein